MMPTTYQGTPVAFCTVMYLDFLAVIFIAVAWMSANFAWRISIDAHSRAYSPFRASYVIAMIPPSVFECIGIEVRQIAQVVALLGLHGPLAIGALVQVAVSFPKLISLPQTPRHLPKTRHSQGAQDATDAVNTHLCRARH